MERRVFAAKVAVNLWVCVETVKVLDDIRTEGSQRPGDWMKIGWRLILHAMVKNAGELIMSESPDACSLWT